MLSAAAADGHDIHVRSAYRSYAEQERTFAYWVSVLGEAEARRVSAEPGHSEHQLGTTADLTTADVGYDLTRGVRRYAGRALARGQRSHLRLRAKLPCRRRGGHRLRVRAVALPLHRPGARGGLEGERADAGGVPAGAEVGASEQEPEDGFADLPFLSVPMRRPGATSRSSAALSPACRRCQPAAAIIAPLSVQSAGGGMITGTGERSVSDLAQERVGGDAAGEDDLVGAVVLGGLYGLRDERIDDRLLERRRQLRCDPAARLPRRGRCAARASSAR